MASMGDLELAERLVTQLQSYKSQGSLVSQAEDCAPIVEALGYEALGKFLRNLDNHLNTGRIRTTVDL